MRAVDRYVEVQGSLLSAAMTYYGFLALFPLVAVALGVASVLSKAVPSVEQTLRQQLAKLLPTVNLDRMATAGIAVGVVGLLVMLYAGVRWVGALRRSLTVLAGQPARSVPFLTGLVRDWVTLTLLGAAVLASVALSLVSQLAAGVFRDVLGLGGSATVVRLVSLLAALGTDLAIGWVLFQAGPGGVLRGRRLLVAAAVAGAGFEVLKQLAGLIVAGASHNVVYGTFAATVGVLLWMSYLSRWILLVGAWALAGSEPGVAPGGEGHPRGVAPAELPAAPGHQAGPDRDRPREPGGEPQGSGEG